MAVTSGPEVVKLGGAWEERYAYTEDEAFAAGDLIRLTASGTIQMADAASAGAVHGIALEAAADAAADVAVLMFAPDTIVKIQCYNTVAPEDLTKGVAYTLDVTTKKHSITSTTTNGVAMVVDYAVSEQPWGDRTGVFDEDITDNNNSVLVRFLTATLDAHETAA